MISVCSWQNEREGGKKASKKSEQKALFTFGRYIYQKFPDSCISTGLDILQFLDLLDVYPLLEQRYKCGKERNV